MSLKLFKVFSVAVDILQWLITSQLRGCGGLMTGTCHLSELSDPLFIGFCLANRWTDQQWNSRRKHRTFKHCAKLPEVCCSWWFEGLWICKVEGKVASETEQ